MLGAKKFAGCFLSGTRQRNFLPGARPGGTRQIKASGKASFAGCRHSANSSRRQKLVFAGCRPLGKIWPPAKVAGLTAASGRQPLPGATPLGTRQRIFLIFFFKFLCRVPHDLAPGKGFFAGCPGWHPANYFFVFVFLTPYFLWGLATVNISLFQNLGQL